jgi:hypothetical protein
MSAVPLPDQKDEKKKEKKVAGGTKLQRGKRRAVSLVRAAKRLCRAATADSEDAVEEAKSMIESLQEFIDDQDDTVFWVGAAFGSKGRYGTVVGWVSTDDTKDREKWIEDKFTNPWSGESEPTFGTCPKSQFHDRD